MALRLDEWIGQTNAAQHLRALLCQDRMHHALLFVGPDGAGKYASARILATILLCDKRGQTGDAACGTCPSCAKVGAAAHADLRVLDTDARTLKVDDVRAAGKALQLRAAEGRLKVLIIRDADRLTVEAQNALLKTLEEPPPASQLILTTARPRALLSTVLSRCQEVRFVRVEPRGIAEVLVAKRDRAAALDRSLARGTRGGAILALGASQDWAEDKAELLELLGLLIKWLHDQLAVAAGVRIEGREGIANVDRQTEIEALARERGLTEVVRRADAVLKAERALTLSYNLNPQMILERLCLELAGLRVGAEPEVRR